MCVAIPATRISGSCIGHRFWGGQPQKLVSDVDSNVTFSPDGSKFAFIRYDNPVEGQYQLIIRSLDSGEERVLISGSNSQQIYAPAWSPDGKTIVCNAVHVGKSIQRWDERWDEFYMAPSATTINENGKHWQYAVPRRVVQRSSTLLVLESPRMSLARDALWHNGL